MPLKAFHCVVQNDFDAVNKEEKSYKPIPIVRDVTNMIVMNNFTTIKEEIEQIALSEMEKALEEDSE